MTQRVKDLLDLVKCRIQFTSPEGEYEGYVLIVCPVSKKIMVSKILILPKRTPMGTLNFNFRDIMSYKIISRPDGIQTNNGSTNQSSTYARNTCIIDDCSEADDIESITDECVNDLYEEEEYALTLPSIFTSRIPVENFVVDRINEDFRQTVEHIFEQDCIGVAFEGPQIGRNGILNFVTISTSTCTCIFDIDCLGSEAFKGGLKKIFESPNIEKVIHDCRLASDCIFHKYNTRLVNVFDTQVADLQVTLQRSQNCKFSKRVNSVDTCLRTYLEIPEDYIPKPRSFHRFEEEVVYSGLRPLQPERRDVMLKNVVYLRLLKRELNMAMLAPFHRAVEVYLNVVQTASDQELLLVPSIPDEMPQELLLEGIQVVRFKEYIDIPPIVASGPPYRQLNNPVKSYTNYCEEFDKSHLFESKNEFSSSGSEVSDSDKSTSPRLFSVSQGGSPFTYKNDSSCSSDFGCGGKSNKSLTVGKNVQVVDQSTSLKYFPSKEYSKIAKIPMVVKNPSLSSTVKLLNSDFENLNSNETSPSAQFFNDISMLRPKLSSDHLSDVEKSMSPIQQDISRVRVKLPSGNFPNAAKSISAINQDIRKFRTTLLSPDGFPKAEKSRSTLNQDSSDSDSEFKFQRQAYQDIVIELLETKKLQSSKSSTISTESSSGSVVSSDDNPWEAMRAEFVSFDCSPESAEPKYRFIPA